MIDRSGEPAAKASPEGEAPLQAPPSGDQAWMQQALGVMREGLALFAPNPQGPPRLISANPAFATLMERPLARMMGVVWWDCLPPGEARLVRTQFERVARGEPSAPLEFALPQRPGRAGPGRRLAISATLLPAEGDRPAGLVALLRDVTAQREAERSGLETERLRAVSDLSAEVAHALTNQLTVMAGALDIAHDFDPPGLPRAPMVAALRAAAQATALLRRLQALARHDPQRPERVNPRELLPALAERLRPLLPEGASLNWSVAPDTPPMLCDPRHLETALLSVMMGGIDEAKDCRLALSAEAENSGVKISVSGLPAPRPFTGASPRKDSLTDMLSAAVSRRFAARSEGLFQATADGAFFLLPSPGKGGSFEVQGARRMLLASGDSRLRATIIAQAESLGYRATAVGSAEEALARLGAAPTEFSLLLIDAELPPPLDAGSLARAALSILPSLPLLPVGEMPVDWPVEANARQAGLPWLASLRDFAEAVGAAMSDRP